MSEKSIFEIKKMDCASEENIVRMKLSDIDGIHSLNFDLTDRKLEILHTGNLDKITRSIEQLNFDSKLISTESSSDLTLQDDAKSQSSLLWKVLTINLIFFIVEMTTGVISRSMGLVADSLDMLADTLVYALSLFAVGASISRKKSVATLSGYFQIFLAVLGVIEVIRRFIGHEEIPDFSMMIGISVCALIGNSVCLYLLQKSKSKEAHMQASMIFTSNDVIINLGVITAGVLVYILNSKYPDLIIGSIVFIIVMRGALAILKLGK